MKIKTNVKCVVCHGDDFKAAGRSVSYRNGDKVCKGKKKYQCTKCGWIL